MENQNPRVPILWEHSLTTLLGHDSTSDPGIARRQWVHFQGVQNILDLLSWDQEELKAVPAQQIYSLDDHGQGLLTRFYRCLGYVLVVLNLSVPKIHHFVMMSSWEPQCHHDIIMRTPRITGKPKFSWSGGP